MSDEAVATATPAPSAIEHGAVEMPAFSDESDAAAFLEKKDEDRRRQVSEAASTLGKLAAEKRRQAKAPEEQVSGDEPVIEEPSDNAAPEDEMQEAEAETPIEPPASWQKEAKEKFSALPRELQEYVSQREHERDRLTLKSRTESAEQTKALEAKAQQAEQLRQYYEAQLPVIQQAVTAQFYGEFADIKTPADARKLATDDPVRYLQYQAKLQEIQHWNAAAQEAQQRQQQDASEKISKWIESQDAEIEREFAKVPETERKAIAEEAKSLLLKYGMSESDLAQAWNQSILRSAPLQRIMADAARYSIAKRTASKPAAKPVPPVQKPGTTAQPRSTATDAKIRALESKASLTEDEAVELLTLKASRKQAAA